MLALTSFGTKSCVPLDCKDEPLRSKTLRVKNAHSYRDLGVFAFFGTCDVPPFGSAE